MKQYLKQNPNKATRRWIALFTDFYRKEGRLPTDEEMGTTPVTVERDVALEIVKDRVCKDIQPDKSLLIGIDIKLLTL